MLEITLTILFMSLAFAAGWIASFFYNYKTLFVMLTLQEILDHLNGLTLSEHSSHVNAIVLDFRPKLAAKVEELNAQLQPLRDEKAAAELEAANKQAELEAAIAAAQPAIAALQATAAAKQLQLDAASKGYNDGTLLLNELNEDLDPFTTWIADIQA